MCPQLIPVKTGTFEPVTVKLDNGEVLMDGKKPAEFSRRDAKRVACYPRRLKKWLGETGHDKQKPAITAKAKES